MTATVLHLHWVRALQTAREAVGAAARANTLRPSEQESERRTIAAQTAWLETVDWSRVL